MAEVVERLSEFKAPVPPQRKEPKKNPNIAKRCLNEEL
jgi:hypothetical protein